VLTPEEKEKLAAKITTSSPPALTKATMEILLIKSCVKVIMLQDIDSQCQKLCQKKENPSVLRMTKDREKKLNEFKWISVLTEMKKKAPDVLLWHYRMLKQMTARYQGYVLPMVCL